MTPEYASEKNIPVKPSLAKPYSEDENLMHISHEAGILEILCTQSRKNMLVKMVMPQYAPDRETRIVVTFKDGYR
jgi:argininosuccinate synthase